MTISERNKKIAISRWKKVMDKYNSMIKKKEKKIYYRKLKAQILGYLAGDGGVYIRTDNRNIVHHAIAFYPDHESMLKHFVNAFKEYYEKTPTIKKEDAYFEVRIASKPICLDLLSISKFGCLNWKIPLNYLKTISLKIEWLKAFFDCEAHVGKRQIQLQSVNKGGLYMVQEILSEFKIESKIYRYKRKNNKWNVNYILCILKKDSLKKFYSKVGFNHTVKLKKLKEVIGASVG